MTILHHGRLTYAATGRHSHQWPKMACAGTEPRLPLVGTAGETTAGILSIPEHLGIFLNVVQQQRQGLLMVFVGWGELVEDDEEVWVWMVDPMGKTEVVPLRN
jgi:hypothetical protein